MGFNHAGQIVSSQLPDKLDKEQFVVRGTIVGQVEISDQRFRFNFDVDSLNYYDPGSGLQSEVSPALETVLLSWYGNGKPLRTIESGQHWQFMVRLRKPRGLLNLGGFDYQAWLFENAISATGYIVESPLNQPLANLYCSPACHI